METNEFKKTFGKYVFDDNTLKKYISFKNFKKYLKTKELGEGLSPSLARLIAGAIKKWAMKFNVTHYCHWFMPLTGKTAEKQVSFIEITGNGKVIEDFSEKSLIKGETDASSFPNGGERLTFEARGYTVWDYTSPVFIKEDLYGNKVLCIPTAFCAYSGLALDEKTPLLRALERVNKQSKRILKALGHDNFKRVICNAGAEQEYFLIKKEDYEKRLDLKLTKRTLLGKDPIRSQEESCHYFGAIDDEISLIMHDVDKALWEMGITAKIQHNEVAPSQFELTPIYSQANIASDQNQLVMETITKMAKKHGFVALFHEKPFNNINGSGKHINLSLSTDTGLNLLDANMPDKTIFLVFFSSMIVAVDRYYKLFRASTAYQANDLRLGGSEAPPVLISTFIGEYLENLVFSEDFEKREDINNYLDTGVKSLPKTVKDYCDRNRTSPFAYCGSRFEFRMVGSSQSIALPTTCILTAYQEVLKEIADSVENVDTSKRKAIVDIVKENLLSHRRIIFNGNGYDESWKTEAKKRGLAEIKDSIEAYEIFNDKDIIDLFTSSNVFNETELNLRKNTLLKNYIESVKIEAKTLCEMLNKDVYPSLHKAIDFYSEKSSATYFYDYKTKLEKSLNSILELHSKLNTLLKKDNTSDYFEMGKYYRDKIIPLMNGIRMYFDSIEEIIPNEFKPFPSYNDILFKV